MIQLPHEMRDTLVEQIEEYLEAQSGTPDGETVAGYVVELLETVADELKLDHADDILLQLENSGELEATLLEVLEEELESDEDFDFTGDDIVSMVEKICDIEWTPKEGDDDSDDDDDDDDDDEDDFFDKDFGSDEDED